MKRAALDKGETSAVELADAYLGAIEETALNNYVAVTADKAREMAAASDAKIKAGGGLLEGLPVGVKDLFCTAGVASTACSRILEGFTPTYESTVRPISGVKAVLCLARSIVMNSQWDRRMKQVPLARCQSMEGK